MFCDTSAVCIVSAADEMASKTVRQLLTLTKQAGYFSPRVSTSSYFVFANNIGTNNVISTPCCRTLWVPANTATLKASPIKHYGYRFSSSGGDQDLRQFLTDEIEHERSSKKHGGKLPRIKDFEVTVNGADITLKKEQGSESILVTLNINNSVDAEDYSTEEQTEQPPEMVSKPSFLVEINKGGPTTLAFQCAFPPPREDMDAPDDAEGYEDVIEIEEIALLPKGQDWDETSYFVSASVMDGNLYELMLNKLEDHGIDADFVHQLVEFSTAYEHQKYCEFLEGLKSFVEN